MNLLDKIASTADLPDDTNLAVLFGWKEGDLSVTEQGVRVGNEFVPLADARRATHGGPRPRIVTIGDLEHEQARATEHECEEHRNERCPKDDGSTRASLDIPLG